MAFWTFIKEQYKHLKVIIPAMTITNWSGFLNQPNNDGVEVLSNSTSDVGLCTIWGTDHATGLLCHETITLNGTSVVATAKTTWDNIIAVFLGNANGSSITVAVGTITIREASADQAITTITTGNFQKGMFILLARGSNVEISNASGKIYFSTLGIVTSANGYYNSGAAASGFSVGVTDYLYIISDNSGCVTQILVMED